MNEIISSNSKIVGAIRNGSGWKYLQEGARSTRRPPSARPDSTGLSLPEPRDDQFGLKILFNLRVSKS
jgi:hypothetical protein